MSGSNTTIDAKDLLQANATIIAGVLILLTLTGSFSSLFGRPFDFIGVLVVVAGTAPFIASTVILLDEYQDKIRYFRYARGFTYWGLIFLFATIVYFLGSSQFAGR
jgi:hypothetical protein